MKITAQMLKDKEACSSQLRKFMKLFPKGVVVTKKLCVLHAMAFDFDWAARKLFSEAQLAEYENTVGSALVEYAKIEGPAYAEYEKIERLALAEYLKIKEPAYAEYLKIKGPAYAEYKKIKGLALAEYKKIKEPAYAEYQKQMALAFYTASRVK